MITRSMPISRITMCSAIIEVELRRLSIIQEAALVGRETGNRAQTDRQPYQEAEVERG